MIFVAGKVKPGRSLPFARCYALVSPAAIRIRRKTRCGPERFHHHPSSSPSSWPDNQEHERHDCVVSRCSWYDQSRHATPSATARHPDLPPIKITWLSNDEANHRMALVELPHLELTPSAPKPSSCSTAFAFLNTSGSKTYADVPAAERAWHPCRFFAPIPALKPHSITRTRTATASKSTSTILAIPGPQANMLKTRRSLPAIRSGHSLIPTR